MILDFDELQKTLKTYTNTLSEVYKSQNMSYKLPLSDAIFCASDVVRNRVFFSAISEAVQDLKQQFLNEPIHVIDAGAGLGILGMYALMHGADKVLFIEQNPETVDALKGFITLLGFQDHCEILCADATQCILDSRFHLLISETITIDFRSEDFLPILEHLRGFLVPQALILPERFDMELQTPHGTQNFSFSSFDELSQLILPNLEWLTEYTLRGTCTLYKDQRIASGDCMSFFNARTK